MHQSKISSIKFHKFSYITIAAAGTHISWNLNKDKRKMEKLFRS